MKNELKKIFNRKEFYFVLLILMMAVFADFLYECHLFREVSLSGVISAYDGTILSNNAGMPFGIIFGLLMPICVSIIASPSAVEEKKMGLGGCIFTRVSKRKYLLHKGCAIFLTAFFAVLLALAVSLILSLITFPVQGFNTMFQADYEKLMSVDKEYMFDSMYRFHPYANIIMFILIRSLFAGAFSWFAYGISFFGKGNRIMTILSPFMLIIFLQMAMRFARTKCASEKMSLWFNTNILTINHYGKAGMILIIWCLIILAGLSGIIRGIKAETVS